MIQIHSSSGRREMETVKNLLKPKQNPQQQLREWQRRLRQECRNVERQIRGNLIDHSIDPFTWIKRRTD